MIENLFRYLHHNILELYSDNNCYSIAIIVAHELIRDGKYPDIYKIHILVNKTFNPIKMPKVNWVNHLICMESLTVYDPIYNKPLDIDDYFITVFGHEGFCYVKKESFEEIYNNIPFNC